MTFNKTEFLNLQQPVRSIVAFDETGNRNGLDMQGR